MGRGKGITAGWGRMIKKGQQTKAVMLRFVFSMAIHQNEKNRSDQDQKHQGADGTHIQCTSHCITAPAARGTRMLSSNGIGSSSTIMATAAPMIIWDRLRSE